jgi:hypothetical protein
MLSPATWSHLACLIERQSIDHISWDSDFATRENARRLLLELSIAFDILPAPLYVEGIQCEGRDATFKGSFSDIFRGMYRGTSVALKRWRSTMTEGELLQIRRVSGIHSSSKLRHL